MSLLAKKVRKIASSQFFNLRLLLNGRGFSKFKKTYRLKGEIGRGGFGIVYRAVRISDDTPVAVKFIDRACVRDWGKLDDERVPMEVCMLSRCARIPGVIRLLDWYSMPEGYLIVMERPYPCIDLFDFIKAQGTLDEDLARFLFGQVATTVLECARHKVLHRDIKDENVVIDLLTGNTRLIDFGAATLLNKKHYTDFQGTRLYCPPEWFLHALYLGEEAAVWSLGVLLYNMLNGRLPFRNDKDICTSHLLGPLPFHAALSDEAKDLIERCVRFDPFARCSLTELVSHPWLRSASADWLTLTALTNRRLSSEQSTIEPSLDSDSESETESDHDSAHCSQASSMSSTDGVIDTVSEREAGGTGTVIRRLAKTSLMEPPSPTQLVHAVIQGTSTNKSTKDRLPRTRSAKNNVGSAPAPRPKPTNKRSSKYTVDSGRSSAVLSTQIAVIDEPFA